MGIIQRFREAVRRPARQKTVTQEESGRISVNAICSAYENVFAQVRPLVEEMEVVMPYGVDARGKKLNYTKTPELARLMSPNSDMGWSEFMDTVFSSWLTLSEVNIHVWKDKRSNIDGYSILPAYCRTNRKDDAGRSVFEVYLDNGKVERLTSDDVITLKFSRSPLNVAHGVSPASSAFTWSQIDDLLAQYQKAFLENGAVPASITLIKASTRAKYDEKRAELERQTKGASNRNKTVYIWRMFDNDTGQSTDEIEVKTIQGSNSTLAIKELISVVDDRLNKAFGVSNFILGNDSSAKYDNAELSDRQFTKRRVYPALVRFWGQFQHELDRITGGLGYAIQFDIEIPELTDRAKTKAEIAEKNVKNLTDLIVSGSLPSDAVAALELDDKWLEVGRGIYARVLRQNSQDNSSQLLSEAKQTEQETNDQSSDAVSCLTNGAHNTSLTTQLGLSTTDAYTPVFGDDEIDERRIYDNLMKIARAIAAQLPDIPEDEVIEIIFDILNRDADDGANDGAKALKGLAYGDTISNEDEEALKDEINVTLEGDGFHLSEPYRENLKIRTQELVQQFSRDTQVIMQNTLETANAEGLSQSQIASRLSAAMPRYRAETIARNETVNAYRVGRLSNDEYLADKYGLKIKKVWRCSHDHRTCELCAAMDGKTVGLAEAFPDQVVTEDGETLAYRHDVWNMDGSSPNAHVNCRCWFDEEVE